jgi:hypothetical protein
MDEIKEEDIDRTTRLMCPWIRCACDEASCVCWDTTQKKCKQVLLIDAQLRNL